MEPDYEAFQLVSVYSVLVPIMVGMYMVGRLDRNSKLVFVLLICAAFPQIGSSLVSVEKKNFLYNSYTFVDHIFWAVIFYLSSRRLGLKLVILFSFILFTLYSMNLFSRSGIDSRFFTELVALNHLIQVIWVLSFYYSLYMEEEIYELEKTPIFWFSLGLLLYAPSSYFLFVFFEEVRNQEKYPELWIIHNLLNTLMYLVFTIGMYTNIYRRSKLMK